MSTILPAVSSATAYYYPGVMFSSGGTIQLSGNNASDQQLLLKAIDLNPHFAEAYYRLGSTLALGKSIRLLNGTTMSKQQLYLKAIDLEPNLAAAYSRLGSELSSGGSIRLLNGTTMSQQQLYLKAIDLEPNFAEAYSMLGSVLTLGGSIRLLNGTTMSKQQLFLKAIDLDPNFAWDYYTLTITLASGDSIRLLNGTTMSKQQLYLKAIDLDPNLATAYSMLGSTLTLGGSIRLLNGTTMTQQQLFLKTIDLNPNFAEAYYILASTLDSGESIRLLNGTTMSKQQLYLKAKIQTPTPSIPAKPQAPVSSPPPFILAPETTVNNNSPSTVTLTVSSPEPTTSVFAVNAIPYLPPPSLDPIIQAHILEQTEENERLTRKISEIMTKLEFFENLDKTEKKSLENRITNLRQEVTTLHQRQEQIRIDCMANISKLEREFSSSLQKWSEEFQKKAAQGRKTLTDIRTDLDETLKKQEEQQKILTTIQNENANLKKELELYIDVTKKMKAEHEPLYKKYCAKQIILEEIEKLKDPNNPHLKPFHDGLCFKFYALVYAAIALHSDKFERKKGILQEIAVATGAAVETAFPFTAIFSYLIEKSVDIGVNHFKDEKNKKVISCLKSPSEALEFAKIASLRIAQHFSSSVSACVTDVDAYNKGIQIAELFFGVLTLPAISGATLEDKIAQLIQHLDTEVKNKKIFPPAAAVPVAPAVKPAASKPAPTQQQVAGIAASQQSTQHRVEKLEQENEALKKRLEELEKRSNSNPSSVTKSIRPISDSPA